MIPIVDTFVVRPSKNKSRIKNKISELENDEIKPMINILGEHYSDQDKINKTVKKYMRLINKNENISLSVKPTQIGLDKDKFRLTTCFKNLDDIVSNAERNNIFVWIDMESYDYMKDTIGIYDTLYEDHENIGICLQTNIYETENHFERILSEGGSVRLVKGAYKENEEVSIQEKQKINQKYKSYIDDYEKNEYKGDLHLGTHDDKMIEYAQERVDDVKIQMLMGIREDYQRELAKNNQVIQYVPYGSEWISYFWRRIRENKSNILVGLKNI